MTAGGALGAAYWDGELFWLPQLQGVRRCIMQCGNRNSFKQPALCDLAKKAAGGDACGFARQGFKE